MWYSNFFFHNILLYPQVAPVTMRYNQNFRSANFTTPSGQTTVFAQYRPVSSVFNQPLQPSQPTTSTVHHVPSTTSTVHHLPSKPVQSPARYTSTSLYGPSLLKQSLITPSNPPLIGQPLAATKEYVQSLNTKPYPRVPVSPSYSDTNAKLLPPKPELKASKKNDNKSNFHLFIIIIFNYKCNSLLERLNIRMCWEKGVCRGGSGTQDQAMMAWERRVMNAKQTLQHDLSWHIYFVQTAFFCPQIMMYHNEMLDQCKYVENADIEFVSVTEVSHPSWLI